MSFLDELRLLLTDRAHMCLPQIHIGAVVWYRSNDGQEQGPCPVEDVDKGWCIVRVKKPGKWAWVAMQNISRTMPLK